MRGGQIVPWCTCKGQRTRRLALSFRPMGCGLGFRLSGLAARVFSAEPSTHVLGVVLALMKSGRRCRHSLTCTPVEHFFICLWATQSQLWEVSANVIFLCPPIFSWMFCIFLASDYEESLSIQQILNDFIKLNPLYLPYNSVATTLWNWLYDISNLLEVGFLCAAWLSWNSLSSLGRLWTQRSAFECWHPRCGLSCLAL